MRSLFKYTLHSLDANLVIRFLECSLFFAEPDPSEPVVDDAESELSEEGGVIGHRAALFCTRRIAGDAGVLGSWIANCNARFLCAEVSLNNICKVSICSAVKAI